MFAGGYSGDLIGEQHVLRGDMLEATTTRRHQVRPSPPCEMCHVNTACISKGGVPACQYNALDTTGDGRIDTVVRSGI
jgi:hypothetical protein